MFSTVVKNSPLMFIISALFIQNASSEIRLGVFMESGVTNIQSTQAPDFEEYVVEGFNVINNDVDPANCTFQYFNKKVGYDCSIDYVITVTGDKSQAKGVKISEFDGTKKPVWTTLDATGLEESDYQCLGSSYAKLSMSDFLLNCPEKLTAKLADPEALKSPWLAFTTGPSTFGVTLPSVQAARRLILV